MVAALLLLGLLAPATAQAIPDAEVNRAVAKGLEYLKTKQSPATGGFSDHWASKDYKSGETALALLAMLKAGTKPNDRRIALGFEWMFRQPIQRVYEVSVGILALEARYFPDTAKSIQDDKPLSTQIRRRFKKLAPARDRRWLAQAVAFLVKHQEPNGLWRYPFYGDADISNAQFAILSLKAARRMGLKVDPMVWLRSAQGLVKCQEQSGPVHAPFSVPAADQVIAGLHDRREKEKRRKRAQRSKKASWKRGTSVREKKPELKTSRRTKMQARGWGYRPGDGPRASMTAAGLAMLVVCKSELEGSKRYDKIASQVDQAMRDGAAWIASRFAVDRNPGADPDWIFYYLYTLERAGTLLALNQFGPHDWYEGGARFILSKQQGDGRFVHSTSGQGDGELAGHCLALLFLKRSTVPVIKRVVTGGNRSVAKGSSSAGPTVAGTSVTFRYTTSPGRRVTVAGSFNGWSKDANPLRDTGNGTYELTLTVSSGQHQYKFVVDGSTWTADPANPKSSPDGHGGKNSIVVVGG